MLKAISAAGLSLAIATLPASAQVLYDGSKNTSFSAQKWTAVKPLGTIESVFGGGTTLSTTASNTLQAGYSIFAPQNRVQGYTLSFDLQLLAESHGSRLDRAGFSIIALSSTLSICQKPLFNGFLANG